jgi:hypothetical protein
MRCRKIILTSKIAVAIGGIWLLALTIFRLDPVAMIGAIAVVIGGTVVFVSNTSTSKQTAGHAVPAMPGYPSPPTCR